MGHGILSILSIKLIISTGMPNTKNSHKKTSCLTNFILLVHFMIRHGYSFHETTLACNYYDSLEIKVWLFRNEGCCTNNNSFVVKLDFPASGKEVLLVPV